jgi:phosphoserine phosphatase RsbU/P
VHSLDPLLSRQLMMLGLVQLGRAPSAEAWQKVLAWVSEHYRQMGEERRLLQKSLELEMHELCRRLAQERSSRQHLVGAVAHGLDVLHAMLEGGGDQAGGARAFGERLRAIVSADDGPDAVADERLEAIAESIAALAERAAVQLGELEALRGEMRSAVTAQRALLPRAPTFERPGLEVSGHCQPANHCGGDWWASYPLDETRTLMVIGDVTGHGAGPAIAAGVARGACDVMVRLGAAQAAQPGALLAELNRSLWSATDDSMTMTCSAALVDCAAGRVTVASAAHPLPYVVRAGRRENALRHVVVNGVPLGMRREARYDQVVAPISLGDALLWHTDGLTDAENAAGEQFGPRRLRAVLTRAESLAPDALSFAILREISTFRGDARPADDVAFVVARYNGPPGSEPGSDG